MLNREHLVWAGFELTTLVVIVTDCIGSYKSNYNTITTMKWFIFLVFVCRKHAIYILIDIETNDCGWMLIERICSFLKTIQFHNFKIIMDAVEDYARRWIKREVDQDPEFESLSDWVRTIRSLVQGRIHKLKNIFVEQSWFVCGITRGVVVYA
jgi:hypothetical protein